MRYDAVDIRLNNILLFRKRLKTQLQGKPFEDYLELLSKKHSKLATILDAKRRGDEAAVKLLWLECKNLSRRMQAIDQGAA